jgi:hypothetical protein
MKLAILRKEYFSAEIIRACLRLNWMGLRAFCSS